MVKERDYMPFFKSFEEAISDIQDEKTQLSLYRAIVRYGLYGEEPTLTGLAATLWKLILPNLKNNRKQFENAIKGGAPKGNKNALKNNPNSTQKQPEINPNSTYKEKDKEKDKERDKEIEKEKSTNVDTKKTAQRFSRPSLDEVRDYIASQSYSVDAEAFIDFYEAKGWRVGNNPMKDWKAAVRTWERRNREEGKPNPKKTTAPDGVKLGAGEWIDANGMRTYGSGVANIPMNAPPRPGEKYTWDAATQSWIYL